jgi:hypothetical protein
MRDTIKHPIANLRSSGIRLIGIIAGIVALAIIAELFAWAQNSTPSQAQGAIAAPSSTTAPNVLPPIRLDESAVLSHLNQLINW